MQNGTYPKDKKYDYAELQSFCKKENGTTTDL